MKLKFIVTYCALVAANAAYAATPNVTPAETSVFTSTDTVLSRAYEWAREMALSYAHDTDDPVGAWYEAALPDREAFCMRDVSHQTVGAHILGLAKHNKNMMHKFASNISESKDWCTYWEINRYDKPAPIDYASDTEFWYNLNANFDVMQACLKMYEWTVDEDYIRNPDFLNFYTRSVNEYVDRWQLGPDEIMQRPTYMNQREDFDVNNSFHTCRGLPSYVENFHGLSVGVDLIATLVSGHKAYADIADKNGDHAEAGKGRERAEQYRRLIDNVWWDASNNRFNTFWTTEGRFDRGEGVPFILLFEGTDNPAYIRASVDDILSMEWNVENMSSFPAVFYRLGYNDEAYRFLTALPYGARSEYPEVSYGLIEGVVCGAMGLTPSASGQYVKTLSRTGSHTNTIKNVPLFGGYLSLTHAGDRHSEISNDTDMDIDWYVSFPGKYEYIESDGKRYSAVQSQDVHGNLISTACLPLLSHTTRSARPIH